MFPRCKGGFAMYSFQTGAGRRKQKQLTRLLLLIVFILVIAL